MKTTALTVLLLVATAATASADLDAVWARTYGGPAADGFRSAVPTSDGGFLAVGYTYSFGAGDVDLFAVKTNALGDTLWTRTFGGQSLDYGYGACETSDGAYVLAGYTMSFGAGGEDVYLVKVDASGDALWTRTYGGADLDEARAVCPTADGYVVVAGETESFGAGLADLYFLKVDADGDTAWTRTVGGTDSEWADGVCVTADGNYGASGTTGSFNTTRDAYMVKVSPAGTLLWQYRYGSSVTYREDYGSGVCAVADGGMASAGWRTDQDNYDPLAAAFLRVDSGGVQATYRKYSDPYVEYTSSVTMTPEGAYLLCGASKDLTTHRNDLFLLSRVEGTGWGWSQTLGGPGSDRGCSIVGLGGNSYIVAGYTDTWGSGSFDGWLLMMGDATTSVPDSRGTRTGLELEAPTPNPFRPETTLRFSLPVPMRVELAVYDVSGRRVAVLADGVFECGDHSVSWDGTDARGQELSPGVYWARLEAGGTVLKTKVVRLN